MSVSSHPTLPADLREQLGRVAGPPEASATLPPRCYTDQAFFELEMQAIFRSAWTGVGRADRWRAPGDYASLVVGGVPVIVLRDANGVLRAFANTCRHRGAKLLEGTGSCRTIRCPFHRWTYPSTVIC